MKPTHSLFVLAAAVLPIITLASGCSSSGGGGMDPAVGSILSAATGGKVGGSSKEMQMVQGGAKVVSSLSLSPNEASDIGESVSLGLIDQYGLVSDETLQAYVNKVGLTVAAVCPRTEINYTFGVLDTPDVNAYSTPGGFVLVTRGALAQMQDESELAGVLAHEIGHIVKDHGAKAVKSAGLMEGAAQMATAGQGALTDKAADFMVDNFFKNAMSPSSENEADAEGVAYVKLAGYDPQGLVRFLERTGAQPKSGGIKLQSPTHPPTPERLKRIRAAAGTTSGATLKERYVANVKLK